MANAFIKGAQSAGHDVTKFETAHKKIGGCKACKTCWSTGRPCTFQDDFDELAPLLESADVLVFATPIYWFSFPAKLKAVLDKMNAYLSPDCNRPLKIKESLLLVCGADEGLEIFDGIIATYRAIVRYMKWENRGVLTVPNVTEKEDIESTHALIAAEQLGKSL